MPVPVVSTCVVGVFIGCGNDEVSNQNAICVANSPLESTESFNVLHS